MPDETIHALVASGTSGRYALDTPDGPDISSGTSVAILLNGAWIEGSVEYAGQLYVNMGPQYLGEPPRLPYKLDGYYFAANNGEICGLCIGMRVKIL